MSAASDGRVLGFDDPDSTMDYSQNTVQHPNPLKRWLHRSRFASSVRLLRVDGARRVLDYGCGSGELSALVARQYPDTQIVAYDPAAELLAQARRRLAGLPNVTVCGTLDLAAEPFDRIACLETVEHLPASQLAAVFDDIASLLAPGGRCLFTFPIEHGLMSLVKNCYRIVTNGDQYATAARTTRRLLNLPVPRQPAAALSDCAYIFSHVGFDCRRMLQAISERFSVCEVRVLPAGTVAFGLGNGLAVCVESRKDVQSVRTKNQER